MNEGIVYAFVASLFWGINPVFVRLGASRMDLVQAAFLSLLFACAILVPLHWLLKGAIPYGSIDRRALLAFMAAGGLNYLLGRTLYFQAIHILGAARSTSVSSTYSLLAPIFAVTLLGERVGSTTAAGVGLILLGIFLITSERRS